MHGNIPYMFDYWAIPVVHLLIIKSSMARSSSNAASYSTLTPLPYSLDVIGLVE